MSRIDPHYMANLAPRLGQSDSDDKAVWVYGTVRTLLPSP